MVKTVEGVIDEKGNVRLLETPKLSAPHRAVLIILEEPLDPSSLESSLLSEKALGEDWNRAEEDKAWSHLNQAP